MFGMPTDIGLASRLDRFTKTPLFVLENDGTQIRRVVCFPCSPPVKDKVRSSYQFIKTKNEKKY